VYRDYKIKIKKFPYKVAKEKEIRKLGKEMKGQSLFAQCSSSCTAAEGCWSDASAVRRTLLSSLSVQTYHVRLVDEVAMCLTCC